MLHCLAAIERRSVAAVARSREKNRSESGKLIKNNEKITDLAEREREKKKTFFCKDTKQKQKKQKKKTTENELGAEMEGTISAM